MKAKHKRAAAVAFCAVVVLITVAVSAHALLFPEPDYVSVATLVVLSLTLVILTIYAYDTHSMATVTVERWRQDAAVYKCSYEVQVQDNKGTAGRTVVRLHNPSFLVVRARFNANLRVYGKQVSAGSLYDGTERWLLSPQQNTQGWFEIASILPTHSQSVSSMIAEAEKVAAVRQNQLTMYLEIEFEDERGEKRALPGRAHYFDFDRWKWIPQLADRSK